MRRMLIENTHPAIIDENTFNIVQEVRGHKHRPTKTGKVSLFSGKVFCAGCGAKLYFNTTNKSTENQDSFTCSNYRSNTGTCTAHYIRNVTLYKMVFRHIQNVLSYIQQFGSVFVKKEMQKSRAEQEADVERAKVDIVTLKRWDEDLDILFKRIYEDSVTGRLSAERFDKLAADYETEQRWRVFSRNFQRERKDYIGHYGDSQSVYIHGDLNPDNIIVNDRLEICLIDFADALLAPIEWELAGLICDGFQFDGAYVKGFFGEYVKTELAEKLLYGLLIHDYGVNIICDNIGTAEEFSCVGALRKRIIEKLTNAD